MKRFIFAVILLIFVIVFNCTCLETIRKTKESLITELDSIYLSAAEGNNEKTALECEEFAKRWLSEHHILCRIVRHEPLEQITSVAVGLAPLARFGETGELYSEILRCRVLIGEIWDSERPLFRNIF